MRDAARALREAAEDGRASPLERIQAAVEWGYAAAGTDDWADACEGLATAVALVDQAVPLTLARLDRETQIAELPGLGVHAAAAALQIGDERHAVELLEHGRAVLLSQALGLRTDTERLAEVDHDLASRLVVVQRKLATA